MWFMKRWVNVKGIRYVFFDVGYTLINEDDVWAFRCREQAEPTKPNVWGCLPRTSTVRSYRLL